MVLTFHVGGPPPGGGYLQDGAVWRRGVQRESCVKDLVQRTRRAWALPAAFRSVRGAYLPAPTFAQDALKAINYML